MGKKVFGLVMLAVVGLLALCGCNGGAYVSEGRFYSPDEAYEAGLVTSEDLRDVAYYYHAQRGKTYDEGYEPHPKNPEALDEETEEQIKITYLLDVMKTPDVEPDYVHIYCYYGTYRGTVAVWIRDTYFLYDLLYEPEYEVGGVTFYEYEVGSVRFWVKNA